MTRMQVVLFASACAAFVACSKSNKTDTKAEATTQTSALAPAAPAVANASERSKLSCKELIKQAEETNKRVGIKMEFTPGSWGKVPPALQKLPPGAEHCGSVNLMDQALVVSGLTGKELEAFYAPLFAGLGCQPLQCKDDTLGGKVRTECKCQAKGVLGMVITDLNVESYTIAVMK
jgi:hypothetical protein